VNAIRRLAGPLLFHDWEKDANDRTSEALANNPAANADALAGKVRTHGLLIAAIGSAVNCAFGPTDVRHLCYASHALTVDQAICRIIAQVAGFGFNISTCGKQ